MTTAQDVADYILSVAPLEWGLPQDTNGFMYGDGAGSLKAGAVCWSPTLEVIGRAAALGAGMIVAHEPLLFTAYSDESSTWAERWYDEVAAERKPPNLLRKAALDRAGIAVFRYHSPWDAAPAVGIVDAFATLMGFQVEAYHGRFARVYEVEPIALGDLAAQVRERLQVQHCRVSGELDRLVSRPGVMVGGLGQMVTAAEEVAAHGADVVLFGEAIDYTFRYAVELGLAVIETEHGAMENPGLRELARLIAEQFPELMIHFLDSGSPGQLL